MNCMPYIGKVESRHVNKRRSDYIVMQLMFPYLNKGRNVATNNYFTFVRLATQLKEKQTSLLGTVNKVRQHHAIIFKKDKRKGFILASFINSGISP